MLFSVVKYHYFCELYTISVMLNRERVFIPLVYLNLSKINCVETFLIISIYYQDPRINIVVKRNGRRNVWQCSGGGSLEGRGRAIENRK